MSKAKDLFIAMREAATKPMVGAAGDRLHKALADCTADHFARNTPKPDLWREVYAQAERLDETRFEPARKERGLILYGYTEALRFWWSEDRRHREAERARGYAVETRADRAAMRQGELHMPDDNWQKPRPDQDQ